MLRSLSIRDIVLIEALDLDFEAGLNVLTGETGAGKSILLDALGFALGLKVRRDLLRAGARAGSVVAEFEPAPDHRVRDLLEALGLPGADDGLILRRVASAEGPSRGFVNDQRVSTDVLRQVGALLVEVHGQHDDRGLLNPRAHRPLLDAFAGLGAELGAVRGAWAAWQEAQKALDDARLAIAKAAEDADFMRHSVEELEALAPQAGEDAALDSERRLIRQAAGLIEEIAKAAKALGPEGAEGGLGDALGRLTHLTDKAEGRLETTIAAVDRTMAELAEAQDQLRAVEDALSFDPGRLEAVEERLFAIRGLARKHNVGADDLPGLARKMAEELGLIEAGEDRIEELTREVTTAREAYEKAAEVMGKGRRVAAGRLDKAVTGELAPLRMENARFMTDVATADPGPDGTETVRFTAAINPGAAAGPIDRIASGGELSRFLLALKVQLAGRSDDLTVIFDEIDRGVGGATANAVGRRLAQLAEDAQVLVVTHSPQVAALGGNHFQIAKQAVSGEARTHVTRLDDTQRRDEIARMLAGGQVTDAARSAAEA
ncbi:MAG: DNA repair protein RecN, partial [Pseudomonadota bacterium]